jgi:amino acid transporter
MTRATNRVRYGYGLPPMWLIQAATLSYWGRRYAARRYRARCRRGIRRKGATPVGDRPLTVATISAATWWSLTLLFWERAEPDCGTTFTWTARAFGPWVGWLGGWAMIASMVIVMGNLAQIAGAYTFRLFGLDDLADSTLWVTVVGAVWILLMTWLSSCGVEVSARLQAALLSVEVVLLVILIQLALVKVLSGEAIGRAAAPELSWFWPGGLDLTQLVDAVLIAVFLYWGWDTAVSVNEESDQPRTTPGRAAVLSTLLLAVTYVLVAFAAVAFAGIDEAGIGLANPDNADDVFAAMGTAIFGDNALGHLLETLLLFSVLTSAAASTQTTILPMARSSLSMGAYRALPARFTRIHPRFLTPSYSTWAMGIASVLFYVLLTALSSNVLADSIAAVGLLIAFYYALTGFACVWFYRRQLRGRDLWTKGVLPGTGGVMLLVAFILSAIDYATPTEDETSVFGIGGKFVVGVGALLLGGVLMVVYSRVAPPFFRGETLGRRSAEGPAEQVPHDGSAPPPSPVTLSAFALPEPNLATQPIPLPKLLRTPREPEPAEAAPKPSGRHREELFNPRT